MPVERAEVARAGALGDALPGVVALGRRDVAEVLDGLLPRLLLLQRLEVLHLVPLRERGCGEGHGERGNQQAIHRVSKGEGWAKGPARTL